VQRKFAGCKPQDWLGDSGGNRGFQRSGKRPSLTLTGMLPTYLGGSYEGRGINASAFLIRISICCI
jgi:hypothetical protein